MAALSGYNGRVLTYDEESGQWVDAGASLVPRSLVPWSPDEEIEVARMDAPALETAISFTVKVGDIDPHVFAMLIGLGETPPPISWRYRPEPVDVYRAHGWKELLALEAQQQAQEEFAQQHDKRSKR